MEQKHRFKNFIKTLGLKHQDVNHQQQASTSSKPVDPVSPLISRDEKSRCDLEPRLASPSISSIVKISEQQGRQLGPKHTKLSNDLKFPNDMEFVTLSGDSRSMTDPSRKQIHGDISHQNITAKETMVCPETFPEDRRSVSIRSRPRVDPFSEDISDQNFSPNDVDHVSEESWIASSPSTLPVSRKGSMIPAPWKHKPNQVPLGQLVNAHSLTFRPRATSSSSSEDGVRTGLTTPPNYETMPMHTKSAEQAASSEASNTERLKHATPGIDSRYFINSTDTDVDVRYAPVITHETVYPEHCHIEEEAITREIHNHDVYHRILPIKQVEVLPTRHFTRVVSTGELKEISAPKTSGQQQTWQLIENTAGRSSLQTKGARPFTARTFEASDGTHKESVGEDGVPRTETTWIHPPTTEQGGQRTGQTEPLYMDDFEQPTQEERKRNHDGWSIGALESEKQFCNACCGPLDTDKQLRRRPVGAEAGSLNSL